MNKENLVKIEICGLYEDAEKVNADFVNGNRNIKYVGFDTSSGYEIYEDEDMGRYYAV